MAGDAGGRELRQARPRIKELERRAGDRGLPAAQRAEAALDLGRLYAGLRAKDPAIRWIEFAAQTYELMGTVGTFNQAADAHRLAAGIAQQAGDRRAQAELLRLAATAFRRGEDERSARDVDTEIATLGAPSTPAAAATPPPRPPVVPPAPPRVAVTAPRTADLGSVPGHGAQLEAFVALDPEAPGFWEDVNQRLNVDELEEEARHASSRDLARLIAKVDEVAGLWDSSIRKPEAMRALLHRLTQNWYRRRTRGEPAGASTSSKGSRRGPLANLLEVVRDDPTRMSLMERLGKLQGSSVRVGLRMLTGTIVGIMVLLFAGEVALFAYLTYSSHGAFLSSIPLLAVWPPLFLLVGFIGGERIYATYYRMYRDPKALRLWDQPSIRLAGYLIVMMIVQIVWFTSDTLLSLVFKIPGIVIGRGGALNEVGLLGFAAIIAALALLLTFMTVQQKAQSTRWTSVGGSVVYFGLTAAITLITVAGGLGAYLHASSGTGILDTVYGSFLSVPSWVLFGFAGLLVGIMFLPYGAHRLRRGPIEDRLLVGQAYLDDLDRLPATPGAHRFPALHEVSGQLSERRFRRSLDACFTYASARQRWEVGELLNDEGVVEAEFDLEWSKGTQASEFFGHLRRSAEGPGPATPSAAPSRVRTCPKCGHLVESDSLFCSDCGAKVPA